MFLGLAAVTGEVRGVRDKRRKPVSLQHDRDARAWESGPLMAALQGLLLEVAWPFWITDKSCRRCGLSQSVPVGDPLVTTPLRRLVSDPADMLKP